MGIAVEKKIIEGGKSLTPVKRTSYRKEKERIRVNEEIKIDIIT